MEQLADLRNLPIKDRARESAVLLEQLLRSISREEDQERESLYGLIGIHRRKIKHHRKVQGMVWVRDDLAHGLGKSTEPDWLYAYGVFVEAIENVLRYCTSETRAAVLSDSTDAGSSGAQDGQFTHEAAPSSQRNTKPASAVNHPGSTAPPQPAHTSSGIGTSSATPTVPQQSFLPLAEVRGEPAEQGPSPLAQSESPGIPAKVSHRNEPPPHPNASEKRQSSPAVPNSSGAGTTPPPPAPPTVTKRPKRSSSRLSQPDRLDRRSSQGRSGHSRRRVLPTLLFTLSLSALVFVAYRYWHHDSPEPQVPSTATAQTTVGAVAPKTPSPLPVAPSPFLESLRKSDVAFSLGDVYSYNDATVRLVQPERYVGTTQVLVNGGVRYNQLSRNHALTMISQDSLELYLVRPPTETVGSWLRDPAVFRLRDLDDNHRGFAYGSPKGASVYESVAAKLYPTPGAAQPDRILLKVSTSSIGKPGDYAIRINDQYYCFHFN
jgi:hypothetical protein